MHVAVTIVGYNTSAPVPYWIIRNQWGTTGGDKGCVGWGGWGGWGDKGYVIRDQAYFNNEWVGI